jgi:imidazolonepropionase-like amidohydrolase
MAGTFIAEVTLFDGRNVTRARSVLFDGPRISWVGAHARAPREAMSAVEVQGRDRTLTPGLIDVHVHLAWDGTSDMAAETMGLTDERAAEKAARNLRRHLAAGVTTVRDLGAPSAVICDVAGTTADGNVRVVAAGRALTAPGGHGRGMFAVEVSGPDEIRRAVRDQVADGATAIKLVATGGVVTPGIGVDFTAYSQDELDAAVDEAHRLGVGVAAHAHGAEGIERAIQAGVDSVEHGSQISDDAAEEMKRRGTFHVGTISPGRVMLEHAGEIPDYAAAKSREIAPAREASFRRTVRLGVRHAAGTDAGTPFNVHGALPRELAFMVEWGMGPMDAMRAATANGADLLRLPEVGVIEQGGRADLVLYAGNPCDDIAIAGRPEIIWAGGVAAARRRA